MGPEPGAGIGDGTTSDMVRMTLFNGRAIPKVAKLLAIIVPAVTQNRHGQPNRHGCETAEGAFACLSEWRRECTIGKRLETGRERKEPT